MANDGGGKPLTRAEQRQLANVRVQVEQLRRESRITRAPLDTTVKSFVDFILEKETSDPLLMKKDNLKCGCFPVLSMLSE